MRLILSFTLIFCSIVFLKAQSHLFVGIHTTPTYFNNSRKYDNNVYELYLGLNKKQFYWVNGISIEYQFDKKLSILTNPSILKRRFNNDCVNFTPSPIGDIFYISKDNNCLFSTENSYFFFRVPLMFKLLLYKSSEKNTYIAFGNSFTYSYRTKSSLKKLNSGAELLFVDKKRKSFTSWFSPTIEGGFDYKMNKRITLNSNLNIQTEKPLLSNLSIGLGLGLKVGLL